MAGASGYFRLPLATVRGVVSATGDADALAAWMILRRFAYGHKRELTAAGAKKIGASLGIGWRRAGGLLRDLLAIRYGGRGEVAAMVTASEWNAMHGHKLPAMKGNAPVYVMPDPGGECSYLPDLLIPPGDARCSLARLCGLEGDAGLDALRVLILAHAVTSCADFIGADPDSFARLHWEMEGEAGDGFALGHIGKSGRRNYWLAREAETATVGWDAVEAGTGGRTEAHAARFWQARDVLCRQGLLYRAAIVSDARGRLRHPLWLFGSSHRERMEAVGIVGMASRWHREATRAGIEVAEELASAVVGMDGEETGLFIVATDTPTPPTIRTVYVPTLLAPTPDNMAGLEVVAALCR